MSQLYGKRIRLRAAEREDIPTFLRWINDPEVTENLFFATPISRIEEEKWYEEMMGKPPAEHILVIEVRDPDQTTRQTYSESLVIASSTILIGAIALQKSAS